MALKAAFSDLCALVRALPAGSATVSIQLPSAFSIFAAHPLAPFT
jgi:hypothetical protein